MPKTLATKRAEAEDRAQARATRTPREQMSLVRTRPGNSEKERDQLIALIEKESNAKGLHVQKNMPAGTITVRDTPPGAGYGKAETIKVAS